MLHPFNVCKVKRQRNKTKFMLRVYREIQMPPCGCRRNKCRKREVIWKFLWVHVIGGASDSCVCMCVCVYVLEVVSNSTLATYNREQAYSPWKIYFSSCKFTRTLQSFRSVCKYLTRPNITTLFLLSYHFLLPCNLTLKRNLSFWRWMQWFPSKR